jgi:integrase
VSVHKVPVSGKRGKPWEVRYRDDSGRNRSKRFTRKTGPGGADEFDGEMANARRHGEVVDPDRANMPLAQFYAGVFLETYAFKSAAQRKRLASAWAPIKKRPEPYHLEARWGKWKLSQINNREAIMRWHADMRRQGVSEASVRNHHNALIQLIGHAVALEYLQRNRILGFELPYKAERHEDVWLPRQIELIRNHLLGSATRVKLRGGTGALSGPEYRWRRRRDAEMVSFIGYQGVRIGEACALPWTRVLDAERTDIATAVAIYDTVREQPDDVERRDTLARTKNRGKRDVPLQPAVRSDLRAWWLMCGKPTSGLVFPRRGDAIGDNDAHWTTVDLSNWTAAVFVATVEAVGLPRRTPKHLRHSCVSMWIREGLDRKTVADRAGHSMDVLEKTYAHAFATLDPELPFKLSDAIAAARKELDDGYAGLRLVV